MSGTVLPSVDKNTKGPLEKLTNIRTLYWQRRLSNPNFKLI